MKVTITTLSENTASVPPLLGEQGLSILVQTPQAAVLLDTCQSISVSHNVDCLGIDLSAVDKIVLSHGHFDHTGGLRDLLRKMRRRVEVIAHPDVFSEKYNRQENRPDRYIGIPYMRMEMESLGARFTLSREPIELGGGVMTTGEVPMETDYETIDPHLCVKKDGVFQPDPVLDDLAVIVNTGEGLAVILGCAHRGMINTLYHARRLTGVDRIKMVVGGSHLIGAGEERLWRTIGALREMRVEKIGLCHCTSLPVAAVMAREFGDAFFFNTAGSKIEID